MFRDTFAVELLKNGVSLETVSMLLGHASIKVTEKHYKPWVKTLQDKLETEAMKAWPVKVRGRRAGRGSARPSRGRRGAARHFSEEGHCFVISRCPFRSVRQLQTPVDISQVSRRWPDVDSQSDSLGGESMV